MITKTIKTKLLSIPFIERIGSYLYLLTIKKKKNLQFGSKVIITKSTILEGTNAIGNNTKILSSYLGFASYVSEKSTIIDTKIGKFCSIGPNVNCIFGNHPTKNFVSTHPSFFSTRRQVKLSFVEKDIFPEFSKQNEPNKEYSINIGNDVWIAANVTILDGVHIGDGSIVAANSLVNKDIEAYSIVGGVPARIIKKRFSQEDILFLDNLHWWDRPLEWIKENSKYFNNIAALRKNLKV